MDLSVLKGNDPAGLKAEAIIKKRVATLHNPDAPELWERSSRDQGVQQNPGSVAASDSGQFHAYRKNRRHELDRIDAMERATEFEAEQKEFEKKRMDRIELEKAKTEKRRAKRHQLKHKKQLKPGESEPEDSKDKQS